MSSSPTQPAQLKVRRDSLRIFALALIVGTLVAIAQYQPGYTDAAYYLNNALRLAHGQGLTDATLWTYIGLPAQGSLPMPAFLYWQPLASVMEGIGAFGFGRLIGDFHAAQIGLVLCYAGLAVLGHRLGARLGGTRLTGWLAGLLTIFSGFFMPYWGSPDTFAIYGLVGALSLFAIGEACVASAMRKRALWWAIGGGCAALAGLTRADGILLLFVLIGAAILSGLWPTHGDQAVNNRQTRLTGTILGVLIGIFAYALVSLPWWLHNLTTIGSILPVGGLQTAWMRAYEQIAAYPPNASLSNFFNWGPGNILRSRLEALVTNFQTFVAVEGIVVLTPLMLIGAWQRRTDRRLWGMFLYAVGLHLLMTFVFALPGERGGLFHSAAALIPFWSALGIVGLGDVLTWVAKRRRRWKAGQARIVFSGALIGWAIILSVWIASQQIRGWNSTGSSYRTIAATLPRDAIVMVNDPPMFYYQTGLSVVVVPDSPPDVIQTLATRFHVSYLILDQNRTEPLAALYAGQETPPFLQLINQFPDPGGDPADQIKVFRIVIPSA